MAKIPINLQNDPLSLYLQKMGLVRIYQGKVRDTWSLKNLLGHDKYLLVVTTNRISCYDYVLNPFVPMKGEVLTATSHFWLKNLPAMANHLIPSKIDDYFNFAYDLKLNYLPELPLERCLVVENLTGKIYPAELIFRYHVGGSRWKEYQDKGTVAGQVLPANLQKWAKLDGPLFTPSTKAEEGNDINEDVGSFYDRMGQIGLADEAKEVVAMLSQIYDSAYCYAESKGVLILDVKFEVAGKKLADEMITPDSARFVAKEDWEEAMKTGREPRFLDKQPVRDYVATIKTPFSDGKGGLIIGLNNLKSNSPEYENYVEFVHQVKIPKKVISETTKRYLKIFQMITGMTLRQYQIKEMGVGR